MMSKTLNWVMLPLILLPHNILYINENVLESCLHNMHIINISQEEENLISGFFNIVLNNRNQTLNQYQNDLKVYVDNLH